MNYVNHNTFVNSTLTRQETLEALKWAIRTRNPKFIAKSMDIETFDAETRRLCWLVYAACKAAFAPYRINRAVDETTTALWRFCGTHGYARELLDAIDDAIENNRR